MAGNMVLEVLVRLRDLLSRPLQGLTRNINRFARIGQQLGVIGGVFAGISFAGPAQSAATFEQALRDQALAAQVSHESISAYIDENKAAYRDLALAAGQLSRDVQAGAGLLIAKGLAEDEAEALIETVAKAATAANAAITDVADASFSLNRNR